MSRIITIERIKDIAGELREHGKKIVTTNGSFDLLHAAHAGLLEKAKEEGDVLVVLLNSDDSIKRNKGQKRPIIPESERAIMLASLRSVDYVVIFPQDKPLEYLAQIRPDLHVKGGSYNVSKTIEEETLVRSWGGTCKYFEFEPGISSTEIINRIIERYR